VSRGPRVNYRTVSCARFQIIRRAGDRSSYTRVRVADGYDFAIQTNPRHGGVSLPRRRL